MSTLTKSQIVEFENLAFRLFMQINDPTKNVETYLSESIIVNDHPWLKRVYVNSAAMFRQFLRGPATLDDPSQGGFYGFTTSTRSMSFSLCLWHQITPIPDWRKEGDTTFELLEEVLVILREKVGA